MNRGVEFVCAQPRSGLGLAVYHTMLPLTAVKVSKPQHLIRERDEELNSTASILRGCCRTHRNIISLFQQERLDQSSKVSTVQKRSPTYPLRSSELLHYDYDRIMAWSRTIIPPHLAHM